MKLHTILFTSTVCLVTVPVASAHGSDVSSGSGQAQQSVGHQWEMTDVSFVVD